jgi:hypothetical protein
MKSIKAISAARIAAMLFFIAAVNSHAGIIAGPITNPANWHEYYLLTPDSWSASETEAETLGGTLAVIQNDAEQEWVFSKFGDYNGTNRSLWIGLHRNSPGGPFVAVTDVKINYFNWNDGEPNNADGNENYVQVYTSGKWNDNSDGANPVCGVAEVPGKSNEKALTAREKSLIGDWYNNGDPNHHCYIVGTGNMLFAIDENRNASRIIVTPEGYLFSPGWKQHVTVQEDKLLWSWGNWWSRQPAKFKMTPAAGEKDIEARTADKRK